MLRQDKRQNVLNMLLKDYELMREEIRNCHSLYYRLAIGFGIAGAGAFAVVTSQPNLPDGPMIVILGFLIPLLYIAEYALLIQYFYIYVTLFVWRAIAVEKLLSDLVGVPNLMNFEREFARLYFHRAWGEAIKGASRNPGSEHRSFFARVMYTVRPQMVVHYLVAIIAAVPALGSLVYIVWIKFEHYPAQLTIALVFFVGGLLADFGLILGRTKVDKEAEKLYQRMIEQFSLSEN